MTAAAGERFAGLTALEARERGRRRARRDGAIRAREEPTSHTVPVLAPLGRARSSR